MPGARGRILAISVYFLLTTMRNLLLGAPGPDLAISYYFFINNLTEFAPGSAGAGSLQFLLLLY